MLRYAIATRGVQAALAMLRDLSALAPFSLLADGATVAGMLVVLADDVDNLWTSSSHDAMSSKGVVALPFLFGVVIYCYEGIGMILPIEHSMRDKSKARPNTSSPNAAHATRRVAVKRCPAAPESRCLCHRYTRCLLCCRSQATSAADLLTREHELASCTACSFRRIVPHLQFRSTLTVGFATITAIFLVFGAVGYAAFGEGTRDVITENLPPGWSTFAVKAALCTALFFTFPVMMVPVYEILEKGLDESAWFEHSVSPRRRCAAAYTVYDTHNHCECVAVRYYVAWPHVGYYLAWSVQRDVVYACDRSMSDIVISA